MNRELTRSGTPSGSHKQQSRKNSETPETPISIESEADLTYPQLDAVDSGVDAKQSEPRKLRGGGVIWPLAYNCSRDAHGDKMYFCRYCEKKVSSHPKNAIQHLSTCRVITKDEREEILLQLPPSIKEKYIYQHLKHDSVKRKFEETKQGEMSAAKFFKNATADDYPNTVDAPAPVDSSYVSDLHEYSDLPRALGFGARPYNGSVTSEDVLKHLGKLPPFPERIHHVLERETVHDGVIIEELSWWVGFGPRTLAYLVRSVENRDAVSLPGVLYLHSHDDVKQYGKDKVVDGMVQLPDDLAWVKEVHYGGRAPVNELAKRGFLVLVHDVFLWGSRGFSASLMPPRLCEIADTCADHEKLAVMHESMTISKYLSLFGSTLAGMINFDDRVALKLLNSLPNVRPGGSAVVGLSGGGCRALLLHATVSPQQGQITATVSVGAMATYSSMIPKHVTPHSWMFFAHDLASVLDWSDIPKVGFPRPIFLQFCKDDALFTLQGMREADDTIANFYLKMGRRNYRSQFYSVGHSFNVQMQNDAFDWLNSVCL
jgi:dienelactone hydrolase